jgi:transposase
MPATTQTAISIVGINIRKNSFHIVGLDDRGAMVLRQKWRVVRSRRVSPTCLRA